METLIFLLLLGVVAYFIFRRTGRSQTESPAVQNAGRVESDWVQPFILFYVGSEMQLAEQGTLPDTVRALATGRTNEPDQSILAKLQHYLTFAYGRDRQPADCSIAVRSGRDFLQAELRTLDSSLALKRFVRRSCTEGTSEASIETQFGKLVTAIKADDELGLRIRNMMLKDSVEELFVGKYGTTLVSYMEKYTAFLIDRYDR